MALSKTTQDHDEIRQWAEARGGKPADVASTERNGQTGIIRIEFPGAVNANDSKLKEISWDEFFEKFDASGLALVYQEQTAEGATSNFNKLVHPENVSESAKKGAKKAPAKKGVTSAPAAKKSAAPSKKEPAKKTASAKNAPAKKTAPAKKSTAKPAPAKKTAGKSATKAPAKKAAPVTKTATKKAPTKNAASAKKGPAKTAAKKSTGAKGGRR